MYAPIIRSTRTTRKRDFPVTRRLGARILGLSARPSFNRSFIETSVHLSNGHMHPLSAMLSATCGRVVGCRLDNVRMDAPVTAQLKRHVKPHL